MSYSFYIGIVAVVECLEREIYFFQKKIKSSRWNICSIVAIIIIIIVVLNSYSQGVYNMRVLTIYFGKLGIYGGLEIDSIFFYNI